MAYSFFKMKDYIQKTYRILEVEARRAGRWNDPGMIPNDYVSITNIVDKIINNVSRPTTSRNIASEIIHKMIQKPCFNNNNSKMSILIGFFYLKMEIPTVQKPIISSISRNSSLVSIQQVIDTW